MFDGDRLVEAALEFDVRGQPRCEPVDLRADAIDHVEDRGTQFCTRRDEQRPLAVVARDVPPLVVRPCNVGDITTVNIKRPYSAYDIALTRRDPGPDGVLGNSDDAGSVKIYDYNAAFRGAAFVANQQLNRPSDRSDNYQTLELTLNKRTSSRWGASTSFTLTKNHRFLVGIPTSPNDDYFPIDDTKTWGYKVSGSYRLPYDISFSGVFDIQPGILGQRTNVFRSVDPDGGTPLRQLSTVTLRLEPQGEQRGPVRPSANVRLSKFLKLAKGELQLSIDALNAFNTNTFWGMTFASGPTFGYGTAFTSPRALQFGVAYEF